MLAGYLNIFFGETKFKSFAHFLSCLSFSCWVVASSFLKDIFAGYRNLGWQSSFSVWNKLCHFFWPSWSLKRNLLSFKLLIPCRQGVIFHHFQDFFLFSVSSNLMMICLGINLFGFIFFIYHRFLNLWVWLLLNLRSYLLFLLVLFLVLFFFSDPSGNLMTQMLDLLL